MLVGKIINEAGALGLVANAELCELSHFFTLKSSQLQNPFHRLSEMGWASLLPTLSP